MRFIKDILRDIRARQNLDVYITVAIAVMVAVLGVIGLAGSAIISSAILAVLSMVSIWLVQSRRESDEIRLALAKMDDLQRRLEDLSESLGTKVTFVPARAGQYALVAQDLVELVSQASQELLVLDYVPLEEREGKVLYLEEDKMTPWRRKYYDNIEEKVQDEQSKFRYRRIIQVPRGRQVADLLVDDPILRGHCETIVGFGERLPEIASIKRCDIVYHDQELRSES